MRDVKITAVLNGWVAKVGCQTLVYNDKKTLLHDLGAYMSNPKGKEQAFIKNAVNKHLIANTPTGEPIPCSVNAVPVHPPESPLRGHAIAESVPSYPHVGCAAVEANQRASRSTL